MTNERWTYDDGKLVDNQYNTFYPIDDSEENVLLLCNRLNLQDIEHKESLEMIEVLKETLNEKEESIHELRTKLYEKKEYNPTEINKKISRYSDGLTSALRRKELTFSEYCMISKVITDIKGLFE